MMSLWDALRMNMMISYQELVRTFPLCLLPPQRLLVLLFVFFELIAWFYFGWIVIDFVWLSGSFLDVRILFVACFVIWGGDE
ncbi:ydjO [Escherichia coli]|nr:hypothetical protein [Escherichia coli]SQJ69730.1 ydjO [Escherichia coli]SQN39533.1 ydjO [Escherichia coli]SQN98578.1 ydjO [Escherichia coli]SQO01287.1 ydjO [Escherichia coli]